MKSVLRNAVRMTVVASLALAGCTVGPDYHAPAPTLPAQWASRNMVRAATTQPSVPTTQPAHVARWWQAFDDPTLTALEDQAAQGNLSVLQAESRLRQARAARAVAASGFWPSVNANGSYTRSRTPGLVRANTSNFFQAGLDAAWELDIFGGTRRNIEAAEAGIQAAVEDRRDVLVSLAAEVAVDYVDLRALQQRLAIARGNLASQESTVALTQQQFKAGLVSALDVANAQAQVASTQAQIPGLEAQARQTIYALSVLLGDEPGTLTQQLSTTQPIPLTPPVVPVGLPSELLLRRPDIRRAEAQLHAATAQIGVATADLFPKFSLTGSLGLQSSELASFLNAGSRAWSFGPSATWNIFSAGAIQANIAVQKALAQQAGLTYRQTVLTALQDVDSALAAYGKEQERRQALTEAVAANRRAVDLALLLYRHGQTDFLNVLSAQSQLFSTEDALAQSNQTVATDLVALYKALGGGWEEGE